MGVLAVAGGTGDVGRTIVEQFLISGKHKVVVLCRKVPAISNPDGPELLAVNYDDIEGTAQALQSHEVDTIISAVNPDGAGHQAQLNLIAAAQAASTVKRFIPSEYAGYVPISNTEETDESTANTRRTIDALENSGLQYTRFAIGVFMDYFGQPHIPSYLRPFKWALDIESRRAVIPGTGNEIISLTYSKDVARVIDRLVDEDVWPQFSIVSGSDTTFNEMVAIAERVTGDKFNVAYDSLEDLKAGKAKLVSEDGGSYNGFDPAMVAAMVGTLLAEGKMILPKDGRLAYADMRLMSVEELITTAWSKN